jgi:hypothetical protein
VLNNTSTVQSNLILLFIALSTALFSMFLPLLILFSLSVIFLAIDNKGRSFVRLSILFMCLIFALINILKMPESDLNNYVEYYNQLSSMSFYTALDFVYQNIRLSEIIFRMYFWLMAQLSTSISLLIFISTVVIYYIVTFFSLYVSRFYTDNFKSKNNVILLLSIIWCCYVGITFSLTGHVIRQYLSVVVFLLGILFLFDRKIFLGVMITMLAGLVHNAIFLFPILLLFTVVFSKHITKPIIFIPCLIVAYFLSDYLALLQEYFPSIIGRGSLEGWSSSLVFLDGLFLIVYGYLYRNHHRKKYISYINAFLIFFVLFLILFHQESLIFQRYYYFFDVIRSVIGVLIISKLFSKFDSASQSMLIVPFVVFSISIFLFRYDGSPWDYGSNYSSIIFIDYNDIFLRLSELEFQK